MARVPSVESSSRQEKRLPRIDFLNFGNKVTLPTNDPEVFVLQHAGCVGEHCHGERVAQPRATQVASCAFSCKGFAPVALKSSSYVARRSSSIEFATSFTLLSSVDVLGLPGLGSLSMLLGVLMHELYLLVH